LWLSSSISPNDHSSPTLPNTRLLLLLLLLWPCCSGCCGVALLLLDSSRCICTRWTLLPLLLLLHERLLLN
jgi:hypothetical protein